MTPECPATAALAKPGHVGVVDGGQRLADEVAGLAPARSRARARRRGAVTR